MDKVERIVERVMEKMIKKRVNLKEAYDESNKKHDAVIEEKGRKEVRLRKELCASFA